MSDANAAPPPLPDTPPVCPRHPDRVSYVRCQRCSRPVCPDCQRPAAVGVQCPDCVAEGARTVRQGTTVFGGAVAAGRPIVTQVVIGLCVAVYALQWLVPGVTGAMVFVPALGASEPWRFLTSAFAHSTSMLLHIVFNLWVIWSLGPYLESLLGRARFAASYLISALGGSVMVLLLAPTPDAAAVASGIYTGAWFTGVVGASGAAFGLFAMLLILQRSLGRSTAGVGALIVINALFSVLYPNISWQGHLGGFVTGAACAGAITLLGRRRPEGGVDGRLQWLGLGAVAALLVVLAVVKYAMVGSQFLY